MAEEEKNETEKSKKTAYMFGVLGVILGILVGVMLFVPTLRDSEAKNATIEGLQADLTTAQANLADCQANPVITGGVSEAQIKANITKFIVANGVKESEIHLENLKTFTSELYQVEVSVGDQEPGVYVATKDGKYLIWGNYLMDLINLPKPVEVAKTEKATGTLYVFSYCPAGTAALSTFAETAKFFGDKANMEVKFFSNMHGDHEKQQNITQECIQKVAKDKYWDYVALFVKDIYPTCKDTTCDKTKSIEAMKTVGIDSNAVYSCVDNGQILYDADIQSATDLGMTASPSIAVNGTSFGSKFDRTPDGIKELVCSGFITEPADCNTALGTEQATTSGSC